MIALLHAYWAVGGRWGLAEAVGGPEKPLPPPWAIWLVTTLLAAGVLVVLGRLGVWGKGLPAWLFSLGCWGLTGALLLAGLLNFAAKTRWEQFLFGPLALLLAAAAALVALKGE